MIKGFTYLRFEQPPERGAATMVSKWTGNRDYKSGSPGEEYYDIVFYSGFYYRCLLSHTSSFAYPPPSSTVLWVKMVNYKFVASSVMLIGEGAEGWYIDEGIIRHTSGKISLNQNGEIISSNGRFIVDRDGNLFAQSGTFEGYIGIKFYDITNQSITVSTQLYLSGYTGTITLPSATSFIGKRIVFSNPYYPPYTRQDLQWMPSKIEIDGVMSSNYVGIGGFTNGTDPFYSYQLRSFQVVGSVVELLGVPSSIYVNGEQLCRWVVMSGKESCFNRINI